MLLSLVYCIQQTATLLSSCDNFIESITEAFVNRQPSRVDMSKLNIEGRTQAKSSGTTRAPVMTTSVSVSSLPS